MNEAAIQTQQMQAQGVQSMRAKFAAPLGMQISGDPFAMIFQQLLGGEEGEGENGLDALMQQLAQQMQEDGETSGAEMAAEFLLMNPNAVQMLMQQAQTLGGGAAQLLQAQQTLNMSDAAQQMLRQAQQSQTPLQNADAAGTQDETGKEISKEFFQMLETAWKTPEKTTGSLEGQMQFVNAVRSAKQALSDKPKGQQAEPFDLGSLTGAVSAKQFVPAAAAEKQAQALPDAQEIFSQLKSGILENTAKGKNEFVVKLKPDGLGEITVRLIEQDSKISLSIVTSSAHVAKLIADDVTALQNALRPLNAQVQQIVTTTPAGHAENYAAGQQMNAQQDLGQNQRQTGREQEHARHGRAAQTDEFGLLVEEDDPLIDTGLDAYI